MLAAHQTNSEYAGEREKGVSGWLTYKDEDL
jgi:hypothetical protein